MSDTTKDWVAGLTVALLMVFVLAVLSGCATWNSPERLRTAFHATNAIDVGATTLRDPTCMSEANPLMGSDPSTGSVVLLGGLVSLIYEGIYWSLEDADLSERLAFGRSFLVVKGLGTAWTVNTVSHRCN